MLSPTVVLLSSSHHIPELLYRQFPKVIMLIHTSTLRPHFEGECGWKTLHYQASLSVRAFLPHPSTPSVRLEISSTGFVVILQSLHQSTDCTALSVGFPPLVFEHVEDKEHALFVMESSALSTMSGQNELHLNVCTRCPFSLISQLSSVVGQTIECEVPGH